MKSRYFWLIRAVAVLLVATVFLAFFMAEAEHPQCSTPDTYVLIIETPGPYEYTEMQAVSDRKAAENQILILLNHNPIAFYSTGSSIIQINQYLKPGANRLTLRGRWKDTVRVEIDVMRNEEVKSRALERMVPPTEKGQQWLAEFDADIHYELPIFAVGNRIPPDKDTVRKELLVFLKRSHEILALRRIDEVLELTRQGMDVWKRLAYGVSEKALQEGHELHVTFLSAKENVIDPFDANSLCLEVGKNLVMAYTGFHGRFNSPHVFTYTANEQKIYTGQVLLAYLEKHWVWWD